MEIRHVGPRGHTAPEARRYILRGLGDTNGRTDMSKRRTRKGHRSSVTGRWVTEEYARKNPRITEAENILINPPKKKSK